MKQATSLAALLSIVSVALSSTISSQGVLSSCKASDRVLVETRNVTAAGHTIQISTKACSADVLTTRSLEKRQIFESWNGALVQLSFECFVGGPTPPLDLDCLELQAAVPELLAGEGDPVSFQVAPQFAQEFTLGTCLWAWVNNNPVGGAALEYCYSALEENGRTLDGICIASGLNTTAGLITPTVPVVGQAWFFEVAHS